MSEEAYEPRTGAAVSSLCLVCTGYDANTTKDTKRRSLTELVTDALVLQQHGVLEGVPAVEDSGVAPQGGDPAKRQHGVVHQQPGGGGLVPEPGQDRAVAAVLGVAEDQDLAPILLLAWGERERGGREQINTSGNRLARLRLKSLQPFTNMWSHISRSKANKVLVFI